MKQKKIEIVFGHFDDQNLQYVAGQNVQALIDAKLQNIDSQILRITDWMENKDIPALEQKQQEKDNLRKTMPISNYDSKYGPSATRGGSRDSASLLNKINRAEELQK